MPEGLTKNIYKSFFIVYTGSVSILHASNDSEGFFTYSSERLSGQFYSIIYSPLPTLKAPISQAISDLFANFYSHDLSGDCKLSAHTSGKMDI